VRRDQYQPSLVLTLFAEDDETFARSVTTMLLGMT
jgi:hypothetical protein